MMPNETPTKRSRTDWDFGATARSRTSGESAYAEMVPVDAIAHLKEYDRRPGGLPGEAAKPEYWQALKDHIAAHGFEDPLTLEYNPNDGTAMFGEGNHRLQIAEELGMTHVPVSGMKTTGELPHKLTEPRQYITDQFGYFPSSFKPSAIGIPVSDEKYEPSDWRAPHGWYPTQYPERFASVRYEPWKPGEKGKWIKTHDGQIHLWRAHGGPHHPAVVPWNDIAYAGYVQPSGEVFGGDTREEGEVTDATPVREEIAALHPNLYAYKEGQPWSFNARASEDGELCILLPIPKQAGTEINQWAHEQDWGDDAELEEVEDLHVTLFYSKEGYDEFHDNDALNNHERHAVTVTGIEAFPSNEHGDKKAIVLTVESDTIQDHHDQVAHAAEDHGLEISPYSYDKFKPHITIAYADELPKDLVPPEMTFETEISIVSPPRTARTADYNPERWQPGQEGKWTIKDGVPDVWPVDRLGEPHHTERHPYLIDDNFDEKWAFDSAGELSTEGKLYSSWGEPTSQDFEALEAVHPAINREPSGWQFGHSELPKTGRNGNSRTAAPEIPSRGYFHYAPVRQRINIFKGGIKAFDPGKNDSAMWHRDEETEPRVYLWPAGMQPQHNNPEFDLWHIPEDALQEEPWKDESQVRRGARYVKHSIPNPRLVSGGPEMELEKGPATEPSLADAFAGRGWKFKSPGTLPDWADPNVDRGVVEGEPEWEITPSGAQILKRGAAPYMDELVKLAAEWPMPGHEDTHLAKETLPQQIQYWQTLKEHIVPTGSRVVHQWPDDWTVQEHPTRKDVNRVGQMMRNCWQGKAPRLDENGELVSMGRPGVDAIHHFMAIHDENDLPRVAFYVNEFPSKRYEDGAFQPGEYDGTGDKRIREPWGPRNKRISDGEGERLQSFAEANGIHPRFEIPNELPEDPPEDFGRQAADSWRPKTIWPSGQSDPEGPPAAANAPCTCEHGQKLNCPVHGLEGAKNPYEHVYEVSEPDGGENVETPRTWMNVSKVATEDGDTRQYADSLQLPPTNMLDPVQNPVPEKQGCTCQLGKKLECPVHGLHATEPDKAHDWAIPENHPVGFPQDQPKNWFKNQGSVQHDIQWTPGNPGKWGKAEDGKVTAWNTGRNGNPHHWETFEPEHGPIEEGSDELWSLSQYPVRWMGEIAPDGTLVGGNDWQRHDEDGESTGISDDVLGQVTKLHPGFKMPTHQWNFSAVDPYPAYEEWEPGSYGKWSVDNAGNVAHWRVNEQGYPHHIENGIRGHQGYKWFGEVTPEGQLTSTAFWDPADAPDLADEIGVTYNKGKPTREIYEQVMKTHPAFKMPEHTWNFGHVMDAMWTFGFKVLPNPTPEFVTDEEKRIWEEQQAQLRLWQIHKHTVAPEQEMPESSPAWDPEANQWSRQAKKAPKPPNLRTADGEHRCKNCKMYESNFISEGKCWGYGDHPVKPSQVCDSWAPDSGHESAATTLHASAWRML